MEEPIFLHNGAGGDEGIDRVGLSAGGNSVQVTRSCDAR
jgi:hypothetical protein